MQSKIQRTLLVGCAVLLTGVAHADQAVVIGYGGPLTGQVAHVGKDAENGVRLAIEDANAAGIKIKGQPVHFQLVSEDDAADPKTAVTVAQKFVDQKVNGVVGHITSGATIPASKVYSTAGIPQVSPSATNPELTRQGFATAYRVIGDDSEVGRVIAQYMGKTKGYRRVAVVDDRSSYGQGLADVVVKELKAAGVDVVDREFVSDKTVDFRGILTSIKSKDAQAVFYGGVDAQAGPLRKQMTGLAMKVPLVGSAIETDKFVELAGPAAAEGTVSAESGQPLEKMKNGPAFAAKYKKFGSVVLFAPYAYDATWALINSMKLADSIAPADYLPAMKKVEFDGVTGKIAFDAKGDLRAAAVTLYEAKGGKFQPVSTVTSSRGSTQN
ncbi:putative leucine transporter subunit periplasmic-binding component of ABC superfamily [Paraburkholderia piptadeniae]|uniref:Leucine transporter subunit periplasmic-binding component of ABC superfamily n=1 Tax=Paraburkholderia piptadeniae TaxID=1701573 RepID=A0A1N7RYH8_9BURK|nr:branched-chain amino acid ABC transporter substrate-binding protein [Paraburkholderia piptadeniae]SIT40186.1 putative leucine transporter subunit periplasmic-binding component of ABC superfamily [Paraburkholderia piptadeniae]